MIKHLTQKILFFLLIFLILLTILQIGTRIFHNQFDFDEGYNLQIALNLNQYGTYATFKEPLDMNITTGPTVLIPATLLYGASHPTLPRTITAIYAFLLIGYVLVFYFHKQIERTLYLLIISITPLFFLFSAVALGELPGFVFLFFSYVAFSRSKYFVSGLLFALSILTKNVYLLGFFPFLFYEGFKIKKRKDLLNFLKTGVIFLLGMMVPIILWELFKFWQLHFNFNQYVEYTKNLVFFTLSRSHRQLENIERRIAMIDYTMHVCGTFFLSLMIFVSGYMWVKGRSELSKLLSLFTIIYSLYFVCFGATYWYRHFFPSILSFVIILPEFFTSFFKNLNMERKLFATTIGIILLVCSISYKFSDKNAVFMKLVVEQNMLFLDQNYRPYFREKKMLTDQRGIAEFIRNNVSPNEKNIRFQMAELS